MSSIDWGWAIQTMIMLVIALIGYFIRTSIKNIEKRIDDNEKKIEKLEEHFNKHKEELPWRYTQKDDFIRAMSNLDSKLDKIYDTITKVKGSDN